MMFAWLRGHFNLEQTNKGDGADSGLCVIRGGGWNRRLRLLR